MKAAGSGVQPAPLGIQRVDISPMHDEGALKKAEVIKAWDVAVATLRLGEAFHLTCKPEYAHSWVGSPPQTPCNATLAFEVEWCEFKGEDLTEEEDGGTIREYGLGAHKGALLEVALEGYCKDQHFDQQELHFEMDEGQSLDVPCGLEKAIQHMENGEHPMAYFTPRNYR